MSKGYGKAIGTNIDFSGKCTVPKETTAEIKAYVKEKMLIVDDFLVGKRKLNAEQKTELRDTMLAMETTSSIDSYFRDFITARI